MDFQYGDWWRREFERGELEPWEEINPDLASLIRMVLIAHTPLQGPAPTEIFDPIPRPDYIAALIHGIDGLLQDLESDTRNVVLTLARIWSGIVTDEVRSKDAAADWALSRLPEQHRDVLAEARSIYLDDQGQESNDLPRARAYADHVVAEIHKQARPDALDPAAGGRTFRPRTQTTQEDRLRSVVFSIHGPQDSRLTEGAAALTCR
jgi:Domain of unknown function (DUF4111)